MTDSQVADLCRVTIRAPAKHIDLAVPGDVPVADLLPTLLSYGGGEDEDLAESGLEHEGWVLQRLGGEPLDPESTLEGLDLHDGDTLYLRPRTETLPSVRLDNLPDGIADTMSQRPYGWSERASRLLLRGLMVATVAAVLGALALPGGSVTPRIVGAFAVAVLLLAGAAAASRAVGDGAAAAVLGFLAGPFLALAGGLLPGGQLAGPDAYQTMGARLLAASAAEAGAAMVALAVVGAFAELFVGAAVVAVGSALFGALMLVWGFPPEHAAGIVALLAVVLGAFVPALCFRLSGLRMPPLPTNAQQLQEGIEPRSPEVVEARAVLADGWMTALYGAAGLICAGCLTALAHHSRLAQVLMAVALALLLLLHSRGLGNVWQRLFLAVPGAYGVATLVAVWAAQSVPSARLLQAAGLLVCGAAILIASWTVPGRRIVPYWGRAAELLHTVVAVSLLPLALWVLGVYSELRALG
jgi:type VII secretion integral membrane protein EccD